jgi:hypothetical protein
MNKPHAELTPTEQQAYLRQVLMLNPLHSAATLLEQRRKIFKLASAVPAASVDAVQTAALAGKREQIKLRIRRIQHEFWTMPQEQLAAQLNGINVHSFPDLQPALTRLKVAASCRKEIQALLQRKDTDNHLVTAFRSAMTLPPDLAAGSCERFLQSVDTLERFKKVHKTVKIIQTEYPLLYKLEHDWFAYILSLKKPPTGKTEGVSVGFLSDIFEDNEWLVWIIGFLLVRLIFGIIRSLN